MQYITWKSVVGIIQREVPKLTLDVEAEKERIRDLIHHKALKMAPAEWLEHKSCIELCVKNGIAQLPCDMIRLLRVVDYSGHILHSKMNAKSVIKAPYKEGKVFIDYYAIPMVKEDEEEIIALKYEYIDYYAWSVIESLLQEDYIEGKIPENRWRWIQQKADGHYDAAIGNVNLFSITDLEEKTWMIRNGGYLNGRCLVMKKLHNK